MNNESAAALFRQIESDRKMIRINNANLANFDSGLRPAHIIRDNIERKQRITKNKQALLDADLIDFSFNDDVDWLTNDEWEVIHD